MGLGLSLLSLDTATARFMGNISSGRSGVMLKLGSVVYLRWLLADS